jgi:hypothetical protein
MLDKVYFLITIGEGGVHFHLCKIIYIWHSLVGCAHVVECDHGNYISHDRVTHFSNLNCVVLTPINCLIRTSIF